MRIILYVLAIIAANVITANIAPLNFGLFIVPTGTLLIGLTFILRDFVQNKYGRNRTYQVISSALVLSAATSWALGDTLWIVFASALAFVISETADTEIFTRLKTSFSQRVLLSGVVGGTLDSVVFAVVGLSPIGANFLPWSVIPLAVLGQVIVKLIMQFIGAAVIRYAEKGV